MTPMHGPQPYAYDGNGNTLTGGGGINVWDTRTGS